MALGSIFVIALVMGDFFVVKVMSGGQSASVVLAMSNEIALLQYPLAAASAVILICIVTAMVAAILRLVDVQRELSGQGGATVMQPQGAGPRPWTFYALAAIFTLFVVFLYGPMLAIYLLSFQGPNGGLTFPMHGVSLHWFAVRRDRIALTNASPGSVFTALEPNMIVGTVHAIEYQGSYVKVTIHRSGQEDVVAHVSDHAFFPLQVQVGGRVMARWGSTRRPPA